MTSPHKVAASTSTSSRYHQYLQRSLNKHHHSTILHIAFNHRQFYYLLVLIYLLSISNPDTYICDAASSHLDTSSFSDSTNSSTFTSTSTSTSTSNAISCTFLLREQQHLLHRDIAQPDSSSSRDAVQFDVHSIHGHQHNEHDVDIDEQLGGEHVTSTQRYHPYYHYNLRETSKSSLVQQLSDTLHAVYAWYDRFSFLSLWNAIPSKWKMTALSIAILDIGFLIVIKTLVFEDNYAV